VTAQLTRDEAAQLEVGDGDIVWLRATAGTPVEPSEPAPSA
jgi:hypothetical protein